MVIVSATDSNDLITAWSNYGNHVNIAAPGQNLLTTMRGGGYGQWWGTSFSSPVVAGTVALMMAANPALSTNQVQSLLYSTALDLGATGKDIYYGAGRVDAARAAQGAATASAAMTCRRRR
jgi:thermitase